MNATWRARQSREGIPFQVPVGATVEVVKFYPRRRVLVSYEGRKILTLLGCLKLAKGQTQREEYQALVTAERLKWLRVLAKIEMVRRKELT